MTTPELVAAIAEAPAQDVPALLAAVAARLAAVGGSMAATPASTNGHGSDENRNLSAREAARRLGVSTDWLYKTDLPFKVPVGGRVVFDSRGLERWNRQRMGR